MKIIINGKEVMWDDPEITFEEICRLVPDQFQPSVVFSCDTIVGGHKVEAGGCLAPGEKLILEESMHHVVINVMNTSNA